jgi:uncharacterized membrane protein
MKVIILAIFILIGCKSKDNSNEEKKIQELGNRIKKVSDDVDSITRENKEEVEQINFGGQQIRLYRSLGYSKKKSLAKADSVSRKIFLDAYNKLPVWYDKYLRERDSIYNANKDW